VRSGTRSASGLPRSIAAVADGLRRGEFSAAEIAAAALAAVAASQPRINAFITVTEESALAAAHRVDAELRAGRDRGPLMGVPVAVKDVFDVAGLPTTAGVRALSDRIATGTAPAVAALAGAGAVIVGKTNMDQLAIGPNQHDYGRTNCPSDTARYAGGSSGGSAAAVAAGCAFAALGTDAGGSVRYPAAMCGVVGLKPTFGSVDMRGVFPRFASLDHVGVLAGSVEDARTLLAILPGARERTGERLTGAPRIGLLGAWNGRFSAEVVDAVERALEVLGAAGAQLDGPRRVPGAEAATGAMLTTAIAEGAVELAEVLSSARATLPPALVALFDGAAGIGAEYARVQRVRDELRRAVDEALRDVDALALPATREVAQRWDEPRMGEPGVVADLPLFNLTGHPALALPVPAPRLPVGLQLVGHRGGDQRLLNVASWVERRLDAESGA
jgi:aspartyl-tRNA(Asn)/glutamyl-tRNA(Gln) amidotransferase subunit A